MTNVAHVLTDAEFAVLLEAGPDALVVTDVHGSVLLVNAQIEELFGYDRKELIGKAIETLIPERYRSLRPIGAGRKLHGLRKDGSEFAVEISLTPFRSGNRLWAFAAIRDRIDRNGAEAMFSERILPGRGAKVDSYGQLGMGCCHQRDQPLVRGTSALIRFRSGRGCTIIRRT